MSKATRARAAATRAASHPLADPVELSPKLRAAVMKKFRETVRTGHPTWSKRRIQLQADSMFFRLLDELKDKPDMVGNLETWVRGFETAPPPNVAQTKPDIKLVRADQLPRLLDALARDGVEIPGRIAS